MEIKETTTIGEIMDLLGSSQNHISNMLDDPIVTFKLFSDGGFRIDEDFYDVSATRNSSIRDNNNFTGHSVYLLMKNRLD